MAEGAVELAFARLEAVRARDREQTADPAGQEVPRARLARR
jgi:hypothetical protein